MNAIERLLKLARAYAKAEGIELSTVSWRALGDTKKLAAIESGRDIQVRRCERAIEWFAQNWPKDTPWPLEGVRPAPAQAHAQVTP